MSTISDYEQRQKEIERLLTETIVVNIFVENQGKIPRDKLSQSLITITYSSTASLLRRLKGNIKETPVSVSVDPIDNAEKDNPFNNVIKTCKDDPNMFCVRIATYLPISPIGLGTDAILTHTITGLRAKK